MMNILILEDDPIQRELVMDLLDGFKCNFREAGTIDKAWKLAMSDKLDLAIIDLNISGRDGDGLKFMQRLRDSSGYKHLPMILVTGFPEQDAVRTATALNCLGILAKPYCRDRLIELVRETGKLRDAPVKFVDKFEEETPLIARRTAFRVPCDVVLVDQNPDHIASFRAILKNTLWSLEIVPHFNEVASRLRQKPARLVFMNINRHESQEEVVEVCSQLHTDGAMEGTRIVALAQKDNTEALLLAKDKGITHFILDRVTSDKLLNVGQFLLEEEEAQVAS